MNITEKLLPIGIFIFAFAYLGYLSATDVTWINTDSDSGIYIWSTKNLGLSHPTGAPLYNLYGHLVTAGTDSVKVIARNLSLLSVLFSAVTAVMLYQITRKPLAPLIFLASGLVVSQSTIIETYSMVTMLMVGLYHARKYTIPYILIGILGLGVHHLIFLALIPLSFERRNKWDLLIALGLLWYIYNIFAIRPDAGWSQLSWYSYFFSQNFLTGGLSPEDHGLQRLGEFALIVGGGLGIALIGLIKVRDKMLWVLILLPALYYVTNLAPQTYVYLMPSFAFAAIAISRSIGPMLSIAIAISSCFLLLFNLLAYDIGKSLDETPTSARTYLNQLETLPPGSIIYADKRGWESTMAWNSKNPVLVVTSKKDMEQRGIKNSQITHYSAITNPSRYSSLIIYCPSFPSCRFWLDRVNQME